uniref:dolichyl-diphosphooligosaccharide--protein glycotransferase n=1 Tax=Strombidium rassoulzadegani TaxID=1082188 RepID=A0A7S3CNR1_9SPIT
MQKLEDEGNVLTHGFRAVRRWSPVLKLTILILISALSFAIRVFSVIKFESVIHEYDPWFNFRSTKFMLENGVYEFWNWYDSESWHPLGRVVGGTVFPGIMFTSCFIKWVVDFLAFPIDIRNICVFLAPFFSIFQCFSTYQLTKEATNKPEHGLFAALFIAIVPSIISRGVAGSYDNEAVAIWALVNTFYLWLKAVNTGSILWSILCTLSYFYMVASWGGYSFIINLIPVFVLGTMFINKFNLRIYVAYSIFYTFGSLMAMTITFVNFQVIRSSEHLASHITFLAMNAYVILSYIRQNLAEDQLAAVMRLGQILIIGCFLLLFVFLTMSGTTKFSGRSMTLIDPTYAKNHMPLIASVAEHSPSVWSNYFIHLNTIIFFMPVGLYLTLVHKMTLGKLFLSMYAVFAVYFSCVMVRLMLVLAPVVCIVSGIAVGEIVRKSTKSIRLALIGKKEESQGERRKAHPEIPDFELTSKRKGRLIPVEVALVLILVVVYVLKDYVFHSVFYSAEALSDPQIIQSGGVDANGNRIIIDDYREAYYWLKQNTAKEAKILSWWDYGYQITGMSNRTVIVDNNTWNNTHIATVGKVLASDEEEAYRLAKSLDAKYVLVIFGGYSAMSGDDLSKFLWFVRIAAGVFPDMVEEDYYKDGRYFGVDAAELSERFANTITYKMLYYRFGEILVERGQEPGFDRARRKDIGVKDIHFKRFREAYTSSMWMVRIYEVLEEENRAPTFKAPSRKLFVQEAPDYSEESGLQDSGGYLYELTWHPQL